MSWLRNWLNRAKQSADEPQTGSQSGETQSGEPPQGGHIRDAERRSLRRLLKREGDLLYDLQRAEESLEAENQWTERIEQLNRAIEQALADREAIEPAPHPEPRPQLENIPITVTDLQEAEPATITLNIGAASIVYTEEIDWAERGHQVTIPELRRVSGDVDQLMPKLESEELSQELREHLRHSLAIYANQVLEHTAAGSDPPAIALADMTRPCPRCGGWLDQKNRCPHCAGFDWKRQQIDQDLHRIRKERDDVIQDLERQRDRLPVIQRQLAETRSDIEKLREKGVEPAT